MAYSSITKPEDHFNTKLTTGTGSSQGVTGVGFQPDWIWGKRRDSTGNHSLFDSVRGITKGLESNNNNAEFASDRVEFRSNGMKVIDNDGSINTSGATYIYMAFAENPFVANDSATAIPTTGF